MNTLEILVLSLCLMGFWVCYEIINGLYGKRIKEKVSAHIDKQNAIKIWEQNQMDIKLNFAKSQEIEHIEVEEVEEYRPAWNVRYSQNKRDIGRNYGTELIELKQLDI